MKRSAVVQALADLASQGTYTVQPEGAQKMNYIFKLTADLINELEKEETENESDDS